VWRDYVLRPGPVDRDRAERALAELYSGLGYGTLPPITWSAGPRELCEQALGLSGQSRLHDCWKLEPWRRLHAELPASYGVNEWAWLLDRQLEDARDAVFAQIRAAVFDEQEWASLEDVVWEHPYVQGYGSLDNHFSPVFGWQLRFCPFWSYLHVQERRPAAADLAPLLALAQEVPWWVVTTERALLSERATLSQRDEEGLLHRLDGPAWMFADGTAVYAWHGTIVPADLLEDSLIPTRIRDEQDSPKRQMMVDHDLLEAPQSRH